MNAPPFKTIAIATREKTDVHIDIVKRLRNTCPILLGAETWPVLAPAADIIIAWGISDLSPIAGTSAKIVIVSHGLCDWTRNCLRTAAPHATHFAAVSRSAADAFDGSRNVTIIHNGIDSDRCAPTISRQEQREAWGATPDDILIGYVGRMSPEKRPAAAAFAAEHLGPPFRAVLVGGGPFARDLFHHTRQHHPRLITSPPVEQVGNVYQALDLFLLASEHEGFSLALAEAWYCGLPTVSTKVGAVELTAKHGPMTVEIPQNANNPTLALAINYALSKHNLPTVRRAQKAVHNFYTAPHMAHRWHHYLRRIVAPNAPRSIPAPEPAKV